MIISRQWSDDVSQIPLPPPPPPPPGCVSRPAWRTEPRYTINHTRPDRASSFRRRNSRLEIHHGRHCQH
jgi:hypothetical protein